MTPLRWSWKVRFGPYARATLAVRPWLVAGPPVVAVVFFFLAPREWSTSGRVLAGAAVGVLVAALWLSAINRQLRRRRRIARGQVQGYELGPDALVLSVGHDSYTLPTHELTVLRRGLDWLAVRRVGAGRQPLLLLFDDGTLVPQAEAVVREHGARPHD